MARERPGTGAEVGKGGAGKEPMGAGPMSKDREPAPPMRERGAGMDLGV